MRVKAFAKINLGLKILGKREDGFHEIETIFARVGLADDLEFKLRKDEKIIVNVEGAQIPQRENLVWKAAWLLQKFSPRRPGVEISLRKRIPLGAGLGGGSSDAAITLRTLNKLWELKLPREKLEKIAASLGSDVVYFLRGGVQRGKGRGEILEAVKLPKNFPREVLLILSLQKISTKWAYGKIESGKKLGVKNRVENDFEKVVFKEYPELRRVKKNLEKGGAKFASLSGSGSAMFGLFRKREEVERIAKDFEQFGRVVLGKLK